MPISDANILEMNPWWRRPYAMGEDRHIRQAAAAPYHWTPPFIGAVNLDAVGIDTLRGPRQVGKTTACKTLIHRLLDDGHPRVLYAALDLATEPDSIPDLLRAARRLHPDPEGRWHVFLDEVTSVPDWQRGVKYATDVGLLDGAYVLCTGSSAHRMGAEQLVGRRGRGDDYLLLPMSIREVASEVAGLDLPAPLAPWELLSDAGRTQLKQIHLLSSPLRRVLDNYIRTGGLPRAVAESASGDEVSHDTILILWNTIASDLAVVSREPVAALGALRHVVRCLGSPLEWTSMAEAMGARSPHTAKDYAVLLAKAYVLMLVYFWDASTGSLNPSKQRKAYPLDPLLAWVPRALDPGAPTPSVDGLIEGLVGQALFRSGSDRLTLSEPAPQSVGVWRSTRGSEVDFVLMGKGGPLAIEVKGDSKKGIGRARRSIQRVFGQGIVVTRTVFDPDSAIPAVPASVFLAALAERPVRQPLTI